MAHTRFWLSVVCWRFDLKVDVLTTGAIESLRYTSEFLEAADSERQRIAVSRLNTWQKQWSKLSNDPVLRHTLLHVLSGGFGIIVLAPASVAWHVFLKSTGRSFVKTTDHEIRSCICPACKYHLRSNTQWIDAVVSCSICPECAEPWPLLPPQDPKIFEPMRTQWLTPNARDS